MTTIDIVAATVRFGGVTALNEVTARFETGVTGVIGPNGAGKSSLLNAMTGMARLSGGSITLDGAAIHNTKPDKVARLGLRRTFQNVRLFKGQSVLDNVAAGAVTGLRGRGAASRARERAAETLLDLGLEAMAAQRPAELTYANQRKVEIARCLVADPKVVLLDEPAAGMHAEDRSELAVLVQRLGRSRVVILIEHDMGLVANVCNEVVVMDFGAVLTSGTPEAVRNDSRVIEAYLGGT